MVTPAVAVVALEPNAVLVFQDSYVRRVAAQADGLSVRFSAACVCSPEGGTRYMPAVELAFSSAQWQGPLTDCVGRLSGGCWGVNGEVHTRLPLPLAASGPVSAEFQFANGAWLRVSAAGLVCRLPAALTLVEDFRC